MKHIRETKIQPGIELAAGPVETPALILEQRLELAGRRLATYLRHLPLPERRRHELALEVLSRLTQDPGDNSTQAEARAMNILLELLAENPPALHVLPGPGVLRQHMKPEEMDRRPWVRIFLRLWQPIWIQTAAFSNSCRTDILLYALLLAGLYLKAYL